MTWIFLVFAAWNIGTAVWYVAQLLGAYTPTPMPGPSGPRWRDVFNHGIIAALWVWIYRLS